MAEPKPKADKDFSKAVDELLPEANKLAKTDPQAAIDKLTLLEKQTRQASDLPSVNRVITAIVTIAKDSGDWSLLNEQALLLSKKHGQLRQAITKMVQTVMGFFDEAPSLEAKLSAIETLRTITEGKIFVEVERARVTRILSNIKKDQGDIDSATDILCELQVETFGSMSRREKTEFILDQIALCIQKGDWTQATIIGRKISTRYFARKQAKAVEDAAKSGASTKDAAAKDVKKEKAKPPTKGGELEAGGGLDDPSPDAKEADDDVTDLKLRYYEQQILLAKHEDKYLDACKHWRQVLDTPAVENDPAQLQTALQRVIYFVILAPHDNEQSDLLQRVYRDVRNAQVPVDAELLKLFTVSELMRWPLVQEKYQSHLCAGDVFAAQPTLASGKGSSGADEARQHQRWQDLRKRVIEHNVRVVAKYYTRIRIPKLTQLLDLSEEETEQHISELVVGKTIYAKIDRPAKIVTFKQPVDPDDVLNEWSGKMKSLLGLLERVDHLIVKEEMIARINPNSRSTTA